MGLLPPAVAAHVAILSSSSSDKSDVRAAALALIDVVQREEVPFEAIHMMSRAARKSWERIKSERVRYSLLELAQKVRSTVHVRVPARGMIKAGVHWHAKLTLWTHHRFPTNTVMFCPPLHAARFRVQARAL